jgi:hypothetical protein
MSGLCALLTCTRHERLELMQCQPSSSLDMLDKYSSWSMTPVDIHIPSRNIAFSPPYVLCTTC